MQIIVMLCRDMLINDELATVFDNFNLSLFYFYLLRGEHSQLSHFSER